MWHLVRFVLVAALVLGVADPAEARPNGKLEGALGTLWEYLLETPPAHNPFAGGDECVDLSRQSRQLRHLGRIVAPFAPLGRTPIDCIVRPGTKVFVTAESSECSTVEAPPFFGADEAELRACALAADAGFAVPTVTLDGEPVTVTEVETGLLTIEIPDDNILGVPAQGALSVGHGWVALLPQMSPGAHEIVIEIVGTDAFGDPVDFTGTTTVIVRSGRSNPR